MKKGSFLISVSFYFREDDEEEGDQISFLDLASGVCKTRVTAAFMTPKWIIARRETKWG